MFGMHSQCIAFETVHIELIERFYNIAFMSQAVVQTILTERATTARIQPLTIILLIQKNKTSQKHCTELKANNDNNKTSNGNTGRSTTLRWTVNDSRVSVHVHTRTKHRNVHVHVGYIENKETHPKI